MENLFPPEILNMLIINSHLNQVKVELHQSLEEGLMAGAASSLAVEDVGGSRWRRRPNSLISFASFFLNGPIREECEKSNGYSIHSSIFNEKSTLNRK